MRAGALPVPARDLRYGTSSCALVVTYLDMGRSEPIIPPFTCLMAADIYTRLFISTRTYTHART